MKLNEPSGGHKLDPREWKGFDIPWEKGDYQIRKYLGERYSSMTYEQLAEVYEELAQGYRQNRISKATLVATESMLKLKEKTAIIQNTAKNTNTSTNYTSSSSSFFTGSTSSDTSKSSSNATALIAIVAIAVLLIK